MSERYTRLFSLPENLYSVGAPVVVAAGALLKDNQTGKVLTQLKIQNISDRVVKAATVSIVPLDTVGKPLGEAVNYQYLDLNAGRDAEFGQKTPVALPDAATRAFSASVSEVIFADNTVWTASETVWEPLSAPVPLEQAFDDKELVTQYRIKYGENCKCIFKREKDLWRCACGALNHENERLCHKCQKEAAILAALDLDELKASKDKRLEIAKQKAAEEKAAAEAKSKRTKKLAMIAAPIAVIAIVAAVLISGNMKKSVAYNEATALIENGNYDEAVTIFEELGDYKDSVEQIKQAKYKKAMALLSYAETGSNEGLSLILPENSAIAEGSNVVKIYCNEALLILEELGDYQDSKDQIMYAHTLLDAEINAENESIYQDALGYLEDGQLDSAYSLFKELGEYKDSSEKMEEALLQNMLNDFSTLNNSDAISYFTENRTDYRILNGDEISSAIVGEWVTFTQYYPTHGYSIYEFYSDGTGIDHNSILHPNLHWVVDGENVYFSDTGFPPDLSSTASVKAFPFEFREIADGLYMTFNKAGQPDRIFLKESSAWANRFMLVAVHN